MSYLPSGKLAKGLSVLLAFFVLMISSIGAVAQSDVPASYIRLKYATFDPLKREPFVPQSLHAANTGGVNIYIVQFDGFIQEEWKDVIAKAGGKIEGYIPDNAFLVRLDKKAATQLSQAKHIRWVGIFQPAYKLAPGLEKVKGRRYKIALTTDVTTQKAQTAIAALVDKVGGNGTTLVVDASFEQLIQVAKLPDVLWIEEYEFFQTSNDVATGIMNVQPAWNAGYTGAGQIVTIADTGLDTGVDTATVGDIHLDFDNRVAHISSYPVQNFTGVSNVGADDGAADKDSGHGTHVSGSVAGNGARSSNTIRGAAYQASITFQAVEQYTTFSDGTPAGYYLTGIPSDIKTLFLEAYGWGSRIHTNSWGSANAGEYNSDSQNADQFMWNHKDFTILFAAGNEGVDANSNGYVDEDSIDTPATAKNVITIGASENVRASGGYQSGYGTLWPSDFPADPTKSDTPSDSAEEMAAFSSRGPTDDGRIKPDLVAPGTNILSTRSSQATGTGWGTPYDNYYMYMGGTSMATPLAAGAATVVRDYLVDGEGVSAPGAALIKALLINTADDISGYGNSSQEAGQPIPNNHEGWGRINVEKAVSNTNRVFYEGAGLATGASHTYEFTLTKVISALKTTLVWTDFPGLPAAGKELVNDLDLTVTAPNGSTSYLGNHFSNGWTTTGGSADNINNVENVYIQNPVTGTWTIKVTALNAPQGPQPYALVIAGATSSTSPKPSNYIYLPLVLKTTGGSAPTTPYGAVTYQGASTSAGEMVMRYYNGSNWSTYATTSIDSNGNYQFSSVPTLSSGQGYYVRWDNSASNSNYLFTWICDTIDTNSPTASALQCDFDIENINLQSPAPNATVSLPYTFQWQKRTSTNDSYEFELFDSATYNWWWTSPLGYVNSYALTNLPSGFSPGEQYMWFMWAYGSNGHGESYYYRNVTFSNSGQHITIEDKPTSTLDKQNQEFRRPLQEAVGIK